jgi:hypothetical protein
MIALIGRMVRALASTTTTNVLLMIVFLGLVQTCIMVSDVRAGLAMQAHLLGIIADTSRDPLRAEWRTANGATMTVTVTADPGEPLTHFEARFDTRVAARQIKYPPVEVR